MKASELVAALESGKALIGGEGSVRIQPYRIGNGARKYRVLAEGKPTDQPFVYLSSFANVIMAPETWKVEEKAGEPEAPVSG